MAVFLTQLRKATQVGGGMKWSNQYFFQANTEDEALVLGADLWDLVEKLFHDTTTYCYEIYVNRLGDAPFTVGRTEPLTGSFAYGTLDAVLRGEPLPSGNVVRVDFSVPGSRPSRKFYRPLLREVDTNGDLLVGPALLTAMNTAFPVMNGFPLVDVDGQLWDNNGATIRGLTMRRLGREAKFAVPPAPAV